MTRNFDVAVIGGGAIGSAVAYFLMASGFSGRIAVIERDPSYARASTALSAGSIRQQFSTAENIALSRFGAEFLRGAAETLSAEGERPDLGFRERGYLFLAGTTGLAALHANHATQKQAGCAVALLTPSDLAARFPWLSLDGVAAGSLGLKDEGWFDPHALLHALKRKARAMGVQYLHDEVIGLARGGGRIEAVRTARGGDLSCAAVVNAAGPWAGRVAALAGIDLPVAPRKRMVYVFDCRADIADAPLVIDTGGVYFRPEGGSFIGGVSPPPERDPEGEDFAVDEAPFEDTVWPALARRVPAFAAIKLRRAWAGLYDYNRFDQNGIIGRHPEIGNFYLANGFSGHGLQQAPAAGRAIAELIVHGRYRTLDLTRLGFERIARGQALRELNVV